MINIRKCIILLSTNPWMFLEGLARKLGSLISDRLYVAISFRAHSGYWMDFNNPRTFNEKLNWLKVFCHKPEYTTLVDKYNVKSYVEEKIGKEFVIPTLGVYDTPKMIDWDKLPNQFVLKTTHGGGSYGVVICRDKNTIDKGKVISQLEECLNIDTYHTYREWPYKNVPKKIIAEEFLDSGDDEGIKDYKFFCFNGKVEYFKIDFGRFVEHRANYYNRDFVIQPFEEVLYPADVNHIEEKPINFEKMIEIAEILSEGHPFLRVDLYNIQGKIYFGELTFYPACGLGEIKPEEWNLTLGNLINLDNVR